MSVACRNDNDRPLGQPVRGPLSQFRARMAGAHHGIAVTLGSSTSTTELTLHHTKTGQEQRRD